MAYSKRKDMFVRIGGEKAQKADEFLTRSQIIPGENIYFTYMDNYDIKINATTGGGGTSGKPRMISLEWEVVQKDPDVIRHYATEASDVINAAYKSKYGTGVFLDIVHNWGLVNRDHFIAQMIDRRPGVVTDLRSIHALPKISGVDDNTIRIWSTWDTGQNDAPGDPADTYNRINPRFWVSLKDDAKNEVRRTKNGAWVGAIKAEPMDRTMLLDTKAYESNTILGTERDLVTSKPYFRVSIMEVTL